MWYGDFRQNSRNKTRPNTPVESKERARTGMPTSLVLSDMGLCTVIGKTDRDASGYKIEPSVLSTMHRLRTWDFRTQIHPFSFLDSLAVAEIYKSYM